MAYTVRRGDLPSDVATFVSVINRNLPASLEIRTDLYSWLYVDNPAGPGAFYLIDTDEGDGGEHVVGGTGFGVRTFFAQGVAVRGALLVDFAVDEGHRTLLPALRLQRAALEEIRRDFDFAYGFPNSHAVGVFRRLGFQERLFVRHVRVLRHEPYLARFLRLGPTAAIGGKLLDATARARDYMHLRDPQGRRLVFLAEPDARFDALFTRAKAAHALLADRGAAFLRWRFARPGLSAVRFAALATRDGGEIRAYAALAQGPSSPSSLSIQDFLAATPDDLAVLLDQLIPEIHTRGSSSVSLEFLGPPPVLAVLAAHGFVPRESSPVIVGPAHGSRVPLGDQGALYLTGADLDA